MAISHITISVEIMRDPKLNQSQKFLLAEIEQLSTLEKGCIANNTHFSNLIGISKENVSKNINDLVKKGYINVEMVAGSRNHTRIITLTKTVRPPYQNSKTPLSNRQETKENIQANIQEKKEEAIKEPINYKNILEVFNFYADKYNLSKIREITGKRKNKLLSRFKENQDFKEILNEAFIKIGQSSFLLGKNNRSWKVDFDWLIENDTNIIKICEDKYKDGNESVGEWK